MSKDENKTKTETPENSNATVYKGINQDEQKDEQIIEPIRWGIDDDGTKLNQISPDQLQEYQS